MWERLFTRREAPDTDSRRWIGLIATMALLCWGTVGVAFSQTQPAPAVEGHIDSLNVAQGILTLNTGFVLPPPPVTVVDATGREGSAGVVELQGLLRNGTAVAVDFRQDAATGAKTVTRIQIAGTGGLGAIPDQTNRLKGTIGAVSATSAGGFVRLLFFACRIVAETKVFDEKGAAITPGALHKDDRVRVTPAPTQPGPPQTPNAAEVRVLERATQPPVTPGTGKISLVSFKVDGTALKADTKTAPVPAGKHRFEIAFDAPLNIHVDPRTGDLDLGGVEVLVLPPFPGDPTDIAPTADGKGFSGTVDLPANATYQLVISTDPDGALETTSSFYFGTTPLSDARVSGSVTLPGEAHGGEVGNGIVLLLSAPPEAIFESESASKAARAAKRAVKRLTKPGVLQGDEGSEEDPLLDATVRIAGILGDLSFTHLYVPNGQYYLLALADVGLDGELHDLFGVYDIDGDGASDPITVRDGRSVEGLEVMGLLFDDGGEPPSPAIRGIVARVDLGQSQFAIGRAIQFDPNQVNVFGGQGNRIAVRDLQAGFPVLVTLEPGSTPLKATEVRILRLGQTVQPGLNQTLGTIDRIDARSLFLVERHFQFDRNTFFTDADGNTIQAKDLMPGDFVEVEATPHDPPPDYAMHVMVLPSGYAPGQNPDQVTGATFTTRTGTVPVDGATNLPTNPQLQIAFNGPANQDFINRVNVLIFPYSDSVFQSYEARNGRLVADLSLKANTTYTMWVLIPDGQKAPFLVRFTTGSTFPGGAVSGQVSLPAAKDIPGLPGGASLVFNPNTGISAVVLLTQDPATALPLLDSGDEDDLSSFLSLVAGVGVIQTGGTYTVRGVLPGSYYTAALARVVAVLGVTGPILDGTERELRGFYDVTPPGDGKADRVSVQSAEVRPVNIRLNPPPALKVVKTSPTSNTANVPLKTRVSFTFSDRVRVSDGVVQAEIALFPEPRSGPVYQEDLLLSADEKTVSADVELDGNTTYQAFVFYAESRNESLLPVADLTPQTGFSTGPAVGAGQASGVVEGIPGGAISRDNGLIYTYLISESVDLRDLGPGDFESVSAAFGASDGNVFGAQYIPEGRYYLLVEVYRYEDDSSLYGFLADAQGKPGVLQMGRGQNVQGLRVKVSPNSLFGQETAALRVLSVQSSDGKNNVELQDGVAGIPARTQIVVTFSEPVQVSRDFVGVDAALIPAAKSGDLIGSGNFRVQDSGRQIVFNVELEASKDYQFIIRGAVGVSGATLRVSVERFFSTSAQKVTLGSVSGKISLSDRSRPRGSVFASVKSGSNEIVIAQVDADSTYTFPRLPDAKYFITADLTLDNGLKVGGFYDKNQDGKRDDNDAVEIKGGNQLASIDIGPLTVVTITPGPVTGGGPNAKATVSFDFGTARGDDKKTELRDAGAAADVNVSVYVQGVKDLTGYTVTLGFDPKKLAFNGAESDNTSEGTNILKSSGGVSLFLPPAIKGGNSVEFGGAVLAATEATAPDGDGLIGVFRFKTTETFADIITTISVSRLVLKSITGSDSLKSSVSATVSAPGRGGSSGTSLTPRAGDGTAVLDLDTASGDQKSQTVNSVKAGQKVEVQILLGKSYSSSNGFQVVMKFDTTKVSTTVTGRKDGSAFASAIDLPAQVKADSVTYGASILGGTTTATGSMAILSFTTRGNFSGDTEITLQSVQVRISGGTPVTLKPGASVVLSSSAGSSPKTPTPDFDGDGEVGFNDFFLFAGAFGQKATGTNASFDLDGDGEVGFGDFFVFAGAFGQKVLKKPASSGKSSQIYEMLLLK